MQTAIGINKSTTGFTYMVQGGTSFTVGLVLTFVYLEDDRTRVA